MSTENKKVIIIGASSGIGQELALLYASKGFNVGISGRRFELLANIQSQFPSKIVIEAFDVTGNENINHLKSLIEKLEGMDILIYNSGYGDTSKKLDWDIENKTTQVNVNGFIEIVCFAYNYFLNQGHGHIVGTSSIASIKGSSRAPAYAASKAFMASYLEGLYLKARNSKADLAVTDIQPGFVDTALVSGTPMFWAATPKKAAQQMFSAIKARKKKAYITKRWWFIAQILKAMPNVIYRIFG